MSSQIEVIYTINANGVITKHQENDGYAAMRHGPQHKARTLENGSQEWEKALPKVAKTAVKILQHLAKVRSDYG